MSIPRREKPIIANRYTLLKPLGRGGMGTVYRAEDRLTGEQVALKRVQAPAGHLDFASVTTTSDFRIALAQEFRVLAGLRHPNIISVLDYGFDAARMPYFTMELIEGGSTVVEAAKDRPIESKIDLLNGVLEALAYLHRRDVLHRDLKPGNVLVDGSGTVKVLDFGLALSRSPDSTQPGDRDGISGTFAYLAPELLDPDAEPSVASDLYAVGIIIYEMFAGRHPFDLNNLPFLLNQIMNHEPDLTPLTPQMVPVVSRLLQKDPTLRYQDATDVIAALAQSIGREVPEESEAVRESFLQASAFVGRDAEVIRLRAALKQAREGEGSLWLVGGESGVGKSRLVEVIRARALVRGMVVLRGQSVAGGGRPYELWRGPAQRLALTPEIAPLDAGVLKGLVPQIERLVGQPVPDLPPLEGSAGHARLANAMLSVLGTQQQPVLLILEDLHWAADDLQVLARLAGALSDMPLMVIGTYRDDEAPAVPESLPQAQVMKLERLSAEAITELSASMLGEAGRRDDVVGFIAEQTEGNAFFIVEVVRALAEDAGRLSSIAGMTLPQRVIAGGVREVVQRRLNRAPAQHQAALRLAAIAGRRVDPKVIAHFTPDVEVWLRDCANAAVLDIQDEQWRFSHDKLREALLEGLPAEDLPALHRRVAEAITAAYPEDDSQAAALAEHWRIAGDMEKAAHFGIRAAQQLNALAGYREAQALLTELLAHVTAPARRMTLLKLLGDTYEGLSDYPQAAEHYQQSLALAEQRDDNDGRAAALRGLGRASWRQGDFPGAQQYLQRSLDVGRPSDKRGTADSLRNLGIAVEFQGEYKTALEYYERSLTLYREAGDRRGVAATLNGIGRVALGQGEYPAARERTAESLTIYRQIGDQFGLAAGLGNLGVIASEEGDFDAASEYWEEALALFRSMGNRNGVAYLLNNLGVNASAQGDLVGAQTYLEQALAMNRSLGDQPGAMRTLTGLGYNADRQNKPAAAQGYFEEARTLSKEIGDAGSQAVTTAYVALMRLRLGEADRARELLREAVALATGVDAVKQQLSVLVVAISYLLAAGDPKHAGELTGLVLSHSATEQDDRDRVLGLRTELEKALGVQAFIDANARGTEMTVAGALADLRTALKSSTP